MLTKPGKNAIWAKQEEMMCMQTIISRNKDLYIMKEFDLIRVWYYDIMVALRTIADFSLFTKSHCILYSYYLFDNL